MTAYWRYLKTVIRHKYYVFLECAKAGIVWHGIIHDLSKFDLQEFIPYAEYWETPEDQRTEAQKAAFKKAERLHKSRNPHHWEYWVLDIPLLGETYSHPVDIPGPYDLELVCDWRAAGKAYNGTDDSVAYYQRNSQKLILDPGSRLWIMHLLGLV